MYKWDMPRIKSRRHNSCIGKKPWVGREYQVWQRRNGGKIFMGADAALNLVGRREIGWMLSDASMAHLPHPPEFKGRHSFFSRQSWPQATADYSHITALANRDLHPITNWRFAPNCQFQSDCINWIFAFSKRSVYAFILHWTFAFSNQLVWICGLICDKEHEWGCATTNAASATVTHFSQAIERWGRLSTDLAPKPRHALKSFSTFGKLQKYFLLASNRQFVSDWINWVFAFLMNPLISQDLLCSKTTWGCAKPNVASCNDTHFLGTIDRWWHLWGHPDKMCLHRRGEGVFEK